MTAAPPLITRGWYHGESMLALGNMMGAGLCEAGGGGGGGGDSIVKPLSKREVVLGDFALIDAAVVSDVA